MFLNIKKPKGITSHDIVDKVKQIYINQYKSDNIRINQRLKVGHAGTLDPFAEGVLVVGIGRESTKKLGDISKNTDKKYIATLELGKTSSTGDREGNIKKTFDQKQLTFDKDKIEEVLNGFTGKILQRPHRFSAIKIQGEPAYKKARRGEDFEIPEKEVEIKEIEILEYNPPYLKLRVVCGGGTYIRSLAEDIGKKLGTGAYLTQLTRVRVGNFKIEDSKTLEDLEKRI